jgi:NAD(P)-dependent dehydrogenase (short-subunit alcohol dehydrogenase family)
MPCFHSTKAAKSGLERFTEALGAELMPDGIRVTMVRAGQMMDADSKPVAGAEIGRRFAEENLKRGLDLRARPISSFESVAEVFSTLIGLPDDVNVPCISLEARAHSAARGGSASAQNRLMSTYSWRRGYEMLCSNIDIINYIRSAR